MDDFNFFTATDRQDISYQTCVGGSVLIGAAVGRFGMVPGVLAGAATGLAIGLLTCKRLAPAIERKLFSAHEPLTEDELLHVLKVVRAETGAESKADVLYLLSHARRAIALQDGKITNQKRSCQPTRLAARQLLAERS